MYSKKYIYKMCGEKKNRTCTKYIWHRFPSTQINYLNKFSEPK